jgi:hypothetical protein
MHHHPDPPAGGRGGGSCHLSVSASYPTMGIDRQRLLPSSCSLSPGHGGEGWGENPAARPLPIGGPGTVSHHGGSDRPCRANQNWSYPLPRNQRFLGRGSTAALRVVRSRSAPSSTGHRNSGSGTRSGRPAECSFLLPGAGVGVSAETCRAGSLTAAYAPRVGGARPICRYDESVLVRAGVAKFSSAADGRGPLPAWRSGCGALRRGRRRSAASAPARRRTAAGSRRRHRRHRAPASPSR